MDMPSLIHADTPLSYFAPQPHDRWKTCPNLQSSTSKTTLKPTLCVGAHTTVYKILKEKQQSQSLFSAFVSATQSSLRHLATEEKPKSNLLRYC